MSTLPKVSSKLLPRRGFEDADPTSHRERHLSRGERILEDLRREIAGEEGTDAFERDTPEPLDDDPGLDLALWREDYERFKRDGNWTARMVADRIIERLREEAFEGEVSTDLVPLEALGMGEEFCQQVAAIVNGDIRFDTFGTRAE